MSSLNFPWHILILCPLIPPLVKTLQKCLNINVIIHFEKVLKQVKLIEILLYIFILLKQRVLLNHPPLENLSIYIQLLLQYT